MGIPSSDTGIIFTWRNLHIISKSSESGELTLIVNFKNSIEIHYLKIKLKIDNKCVVRNLKHLKNRNFVHDFLFVTNVLAQTVNMTVNNSCTTVRYNFLNETFFFQNERKGNRENICTLPCLFGHSFIGWGPVKDCYLLKWVGVDVENIYFSLLY